jgi:hypothetical protein
MQMQGSSPCSAALYTQPFDALSYRARASTFQSVSGSQSQEATPPCWHAMAGVGQLAHFGPHWE